jgi:hypothetical protein
VVTANDVNGNTGTLTRNFFYEVARPFTLGFAPALSGTVTIAPTLTAGNAVVGRLYTVTAKPGAAFFFSNWTGSAGVANASLASTSFTFAAANNTLTANFVASQFTGTSVGTFNGVIKGSTGATDTQANAGLFSATVSTNTGAFSGKLTLDGVVASIAGVFNNVTNSFVSTAATNGFSYNLTIDVASSPRRITGTITRRKRGADTDVISVDAVQAYNKTDALTPAPLAATYNVAFGVPTIGTADLIAGEYPTGNGYGILTISSIDGAAKIAGILADGTAFSSAAFLTRDNVVPVYASFLARVGALCGEFNMDTAPTTSDLTGTGIRWFRAENKSQFYPFGYDTGLTVTAVGAKQSGSLQASLGTIAAPELSLTGAGLVGTVTKVLGSLTTGFGLTEVNKTKTTIAFNATTRIASGEYTPLGATTSKHVLRGIIVGKDGSGEVYGFFQTPVPANTDGSGQAGVISFVP